MGEPIRVKERKGLRKTKEGKKIVKRERANPKGRGSGRGRGSKKGERIGAGKANEDQKLGEGWAEGRREARERKRENFEKRVDCTQEESKLNSVKVGAPRGEIKNMVSGGWSGGGELKE